MTLGECQLQRRGGRIPWSGLADIAIGQCDLFAPSPPFELDGDRQR